MAVAEMIQVKGSRELGISGFALGREITDYTIQPINARVYRDAPTLAELRHAFETSPEYRTTVENTGGKGEWTSTFLENGKYLIERPQRIVYENGVWKAEKGERIKLPIRASLQNGWATKYFRGFPVEVGSKKDAERVFGKDRSYFWVNNNGLRAVLRLHDWLLVSNGPFSVDANFESDSRNDDVGVRAASRLSNSEAVATPEKITVEFTPEEYSQYIGFLERLKEGKITLEEIRGESENIYQIFSSIPRVQKE